MHNFKKNVFRGFHFQTKNKQSKYVNVVKGKILDVVIDLRKKSKTLENILRLFYQKNALGSIYTSRFAHGLLSVLKRKYYLL